MHFKWIKVHAVVSPEVDPFNENERLVEDAIIAW
jgi:hypothetical protein